MAARGVCQKVRTESECLHVRQLYIPFAQFIILCSLCRHSPPAVADAEHWELLLSVVRHPYLDSKCLNIVHQNKHSL